MADLLKLSKLAGIDPTFRDAFGREHTLSDATQRALLKLLDFPVREHGDVVRHLHTLAARQWDSALEPVAVLAQSPAPCWVTVTLPADTGEFTWVLTEESGHEHHGRAHTGELDMLESVERKGRRLAKLRLPLPSSLPCGYHRLTLDRRDQTFVIVVPEQGWVPPILASKGRLWGFAVQLYAIRSRRNWGIGDFTDLCRLVELSAELGAGFVGVNPLHALFPSDPDWRSPYAPSSRRFLNVLYTDVEAVPEFAGCAQAKDLVRSDEFQRRLAALRDAELVDYPGVTAAKLPVLERLFEHYKRVPDPGFEAYQAQGGNGLKRLALFDALSEHMVRQNPGWCAWQAWPEAYRDPHSAAVTRFAAENNDRVEFYAYLQWRAEQQLGNAAARAKALGMPVGLYCDLAVGVSDSGADAWDSNGVVAVGASAGAPPDAWNPRGQKWGLPPFNPVRLRERAYAPFTNLLRDNMRSAGALRIDHAIGLMRLYWIPEQSAISEGGYVRYPLDDLLGVIALESQREKCFVIGEALGTVPSGLVERLQRVGISAYRLLYFERNSEGGFIQPDDYPALALVAVTTHDLATFPGFWSGHDLRVRSQLGLFPTPEMEADAYATRERDRHMLLAALRRAGLWRDVAIDPDRLPQGLVTAVYRFLGRSPAAMLAVNAEDLFGQKDQVNMPGTVDEHPNWQRKLTLDLEQWRDHAEVCAIAEALRERSIAPC